MNIGMASEKLPNKNAMAAFFSPTAFSKLRMIRSAAPLFISAEPIMEAKITTIPILAAVLPKAFDNLTPMV